MNAWGGEHIIKNVVKVSFTEKREERKEGRKERRKRVAGRRQWQEGEQIEGKNEKVFHKKDRLSQKEELGKNGGPGQKGVDQTLSRRRAAN